MLITNVIDNETPTTIVVGGHTIRPTYGRNNNGSGELQIVQGYVLDAAGETIGMVQIGREDGTEWMISINTGWLDETPGDLYAALDRVVELRAHYDMVVADLRQLRNQAKTRAQRAAVTSLVNTLRGGPAGEVATHAARAVDLTLF